MRLQPLNRFGRWGVFQQPARAELAWQMKYMSIRHNKTKDHGRYAADFGMEFFAAAVTTGEKNNLFRE